MAKTPYVKANFQQDQEQPTRKRKQLRQRLVSQVQKEVVKPKNDNALVEADQQHQRIAYTNLSVATRRKSYLLDYPINENDFKNDYISKFFKVKNKNEDQLIVVGVEIKMIKLDVVLLQLATAEFVLIIHRSSGLFLSPILKRFFFNKEIFPYQITKMLFMGMEMTKTILFFSDFDLDINPALDIKSMFLKREPTLKSYSHYELLKTFEEFQYIKDLPNLSYLSRSDYSSTMIEDYFTEVQLTAKLGKILINKFYSNQLSKLDFSISLRNINRDDLVFNKLKSILFETIFLKKLQSSGRIHVKIQEIKQTSGVNSSHKMEVVCSEYASHIRKDSDVRIQFISKFGSKIGELKVFVDRVNGKRVLLTIDPMSLFKLKSAQVAQVLSAETFVKNPVKVILDMWTQFHQLKIGVEPQFVIDNLDNEDHVLLKIEASLIDYFNSNCRITSNVQLQECNNSIFNESITSELLDLLLNKPFSNMIDLSENIKNRDVSVMESHKEYLNASQYESISNALKFKISVIKGPPGTGKTRSIASIIDVAANSINQRVLIISPANAASRRILESIVNTGYKDACLLVSEDYFADWHEDSYHIGLKEFVFTKTTYKSGHREFNDKDEDNINNFSNPKPYVKSKWNGGTIIPNVVIATYGCIANALERNTSKWGKEVSNLLQINTIQMIIVDETSQLWCGYILNFFSKFKAMEHLVLVGDEHQLTPFGSDQLHGMESLFDLAIKHISVKNVMLDISYRLTAPVASIVSNKVYDTKLKYHRVSKNDELFRSAINSQRLESNKLHPITNHILSSFVYDNDLLSRSETSSMIWIHNCSTFHNNEKSKSSGNRDEASILAECAASLLLALNETPIQICILTPYSEQKIILERSLTKSLNNLKFRSYGFDEISNWVSSSLIVNTVDSFQGQEADIVFISTVKSSKSNGLSKGIGFSADYRRTNVMLTRASQFLVVFGDAEYFQSQLSKQPDLLLPSIPMILSKCFENSMFTYDDRQYKLRQFFIKMPFDLDERYDFVSKIKSENVSMAIQDSSYIKPAVSLTDQSLLFLKESDLDILSMLFISEVIYHIRESNGGKINVTNLSDLIREYNRPTKSMIQSIKKFPSRFILSLENSKWFVELTSNYNLSEESLNNSLLLLIEYINKQGKKLIHAKYVLIMSKMNSAFSNIINFGIRSFCDKFNRKINFSPKTNNIITTGIDDIYDRVRNKTSSSNNNNDSHPSIMLSTGRYNNNNTSIRSSKNDFRPYKSYRPNERYGNTSSSYNNNNSYQSSKKRKFEDVEVNSSKKNYNGRVVSLK